MDSHTIGPFELLEPLSQGGMGRVWRARHRTTHHPVALKLLLAEARDPDAVAEALRREVISLAALAHPAIVAIVDHGQVSDPPPPGARAGQPYLVMEYVEGGDLAGLRGCLGWSEVRRVLKSVLQALAHAHARGVLHRDVKPANILLSDPTTFGVKVTDFGIAQGLAALTPERRAGTRGFMAPEQAAGRWLELGPWTDLFGVGRVAQFLLRPDAVVPAGFAAWLGRLLAPEVEQRFTAAADAAFALEGLGPPEVTALLRAVQDAESTFVLPEEELPAVVAHVLPRDGPRGPPPVPEAWIPTRPELEFELRLADAGEALRSLRPPQLVGRTDAQDVLWAALREVAAEGAPRGVALSGREGSGRSRLADWVGLRAAELGVARAIALRPGPGDRLGHVVRRALCRLLGTPALERTHVELRAGLLGALVGLTRAEVGDLIELAAPSGPAGPPQVLARTVHLLARLAADRPVVVVLDDLDDMPEALPLAKALLERAGARLLVVAVLGEDAVDSMGPGTHRISVDPLPLGWTQRLLDRWAPLAATTCARLAQAAGGQPGVAVQLVEDLLERGLLTPGPHGLELAADARGLGGEQVWERRLEHFLRGRPASDAWALERAALLGGEVPEAQWRSLCSPAPRPDLVQALLARRLAQRPGGEGPWRFAAPALARVLEARAHRTGRRAQHYQALAEALAPLSEAEPGRIGGYWLAAGRPERAIDLLVEAAQQSVIRGTDSECARALDALRRVVAVGAWPETDPRAHEAALLHAQLLVGEARFDEAWVVAERVLAAATAHGWQRTEGRARWLLGRCGVYQDRPGATAALHAALRCSEACGDERTARRCRLDLARWAIGRGELEAAEPLLRACGAGEVRPDMPFLVGPAMLLAEVLRRTDRLDEAIEITALAEAAEHRMLEPGGTMDSTLMRAEIERQRGNVAEAERLYRSLLDGSIWWPETAVMARINLSILLDDRGRPAEAVEMLEVSVRKLRQSGRLGMEGAAHALLLAPLAALGDRAALVRHLSEAERLLAASGFRDPDLASRLGRACELVAPGSVRDRLAALHEAQRQATWRA